MTDPPLTQAAPLICARCGALLRPGDDSPGSPGVYVVRIEAFADPTPPDVLGDGASGHDHRAEIAALMQEVAEMSERELMDQVYRRLTLHFCGPCYRQWIENPAGE